MEAAFRFPAGPTGWRNSGHLARCQLVYNDSKADQLRRGGSGPRRGLPSPDGACSPVGQGQTGHPRPWLKALGSPRPGAVVLYGEARETFACLCLQRVRRLKSCLGGPPARPLLKPGGLSPADLPQPCCSHQPVPASINTATSKPAGITVYPLPCHGTSNPDGHGSLFDLKKRARTFHASTIFAPRRQGTLLDGIRQIPGA